MNQLKKILFALAVAVSLGLVGASSAYAQESCTANSVPTLVRTQGITELTGSRVLNCTLPVGFTAPAASLTDTTQPNAAVITNSPAANPTISVIPGPGTTMTGCAGSCTTAGLPASNTITFPIPPITACVAASPGDVVCTFSVTIGVHPLLPVSVGVRVNVFASGIVFPGQISTLLTSSPAGVLAITNNILNVAIPQPGLSPATAFTAGGAIAQCATATLGGTPTVVAFAPATSAGVFTATNPANLTAGIGNTSKPVVTVVEGYPAAFQVAGAAGEGFDSTQGTRLVFRFSALPSNVVIVAGNVITSTVSPTLTLIIIVGADANGAGAFTAPGGSATVITGTTVTYEVVATSTVLAETVAVPFGLYTIGTPSPAGASTISVALGPLSTVTTQVATPIPRFGDVPFSGNLVAVIPCLSNIFYPWVVNIVGYDTGFAVANTTRDIFGTASQSGTCVYNFFGLNGPAGGTFTTASFGGGSVDTQLTSIIAPGFSGYVIIQCGFQLGHGFVFTVNGFGSGVPTIAQGGPALIIGQPGATGGTSRRAFASVGPPFGEALGH